MTQLRGEACQAVVSGIDTLAPILKYYSLMEDSSDFRYDYNTIYSNVYSVDVSSFNLQFLKYINRFINSPKLGLYIDQLGSFDKQKRVVEYGYFYKEVADHFHLSKYMVATRNIIFNNFIKAHKLSPRGYRLFRINYDDIEFTTLDSDISIDLFVNHNFVDITKLTKFDHVLVLNKRNGVYYVRDKKIIDIKYTSGWVDIPAYHHFIELIVRFILDNTFTIEELNDSISEYITYASNDDFFGYDSDSISSHYSADEIIPVSAKYLFVAKVMSRFSILLK